MKEPSTVFAAIDVGSNATKMTIWELERGSPPQEVYQKRFPLRLNEVFRSEHLDAEKLERLVAAFREIQATCNERRTQYIRAVAAEAFRAAKNGRQAAETIEAETGIRVERLSAQEEGRLVAEGVGLDHRGGNQDQVIIDIGGGSAEIILSQRDGGVRILSLPLGAVRLREWFIPDLPIPPDEYEAMCGYVNETVAERTPDLKGRLPNCAIGVGGGVRYLHTMCGVLKGTFAMDQPLRYDELEHLTQAIWPMRVDSLVRHYGIDEERAEIITPGAVVLLSIMSRLGLGAIQPSRRGVRDGLLADFLRNFK